MSKAPAMPMYWDAYLADTTHLTCEEHGAYLLLLAAMWRRDGSVPNDDKDNARILGLTKTRWIRVKERLSPFFDINSDTISQKNLAKIWRKTQEKISKNVENGAKGGRPQSSENNDLAKANGYENDNPNETERGDTRAETQIQIQNQNQEESSLRSDSCLAETTPAPPNDFEEVGRETTTPPAEKKTPTRTRQRGSRLAVDWEPGEAGRNYARDKGLSADRVELEAEKFRNYFLSVTGQSAIKLDWERTWQNWVLKAAERPDPPPKVPMDREYYPDTKAVQDQLDRLRPTWPQDVDEFIAYWQADGRVNTDEGWHLAFINRCKQLNERGENYGQRSGTAH